MSCDTNSFRARQGTSAYASGAVTWDNSTPIDNETFTANINELKDITLTPPEMGFEKIDCIGNTAQTVGANAQTVGTATGPVASSFQNQAIQQTAVGMWKVTGTQVVTGDEQWVDVLGLGTGQAITGSYTRYAFGGINADGSFDRTTIGSFRLYLNNASEELTLLLANVHVTLGDIKPTGADGHYEREFEIICLAKDGAMEFLD